MTRRSADIYSLGVVFYQMLTGELPLGRFAVPSRKVQIDVRLDEIVLRALEKEPDLRFQQAGAFKTEVETVSSTRAAPPGKPAPAGETRRLKPWQVALNGVTILVIAIVILKFFERTPAASEPAPIQPTVVQQSLPPTANFPTDFDLMESNPEILRLQLVQAERNREYTADRYRVGNATNLSLTAADKQVAMIKAKIAGDRVAFAQVSVTFAERDFAETDVRRRAGLITDAELQEKELALKIAKVHLRDAETMTANSPSK